MTIAQESTIAQFLTARRAAATDGRRETMTTEADMKSNQQNNVIELRPAGNCADCGQHWTVAAGGLNKFEQCPICEAKFPIDGGESVAVSGDQLEGLLADQGVGLGYC